MHISFLVYCLSSPLEGRLPKVRDSVSILCSIPSVYDNALNK